MTEDSGTKLTRIGRPFEKGRSGNPGGRPTVPAEVRERARTYTIEAIDALAVDLQHEDWRARHSAANSLLDRAWGKATQPHDVGETAAEALHALANALTASSED